MILKSGNVKANEVAPLAKTTRVAEEQNPAYTFPHGNGFLWTHTGSQRSPRCMYHAWPSGAATGLGEPPPQQRLPRAPAPS